MRLIVLLAGLAMIALGAAYLVNHPHTDADWLAWAAVAGGVGLSVVHGPPTGRRPWTWR